MRSRIKIVKDPMIIRAEIIDFIPPSDGFGTAMKNTRKLKVMISTDKVETALLLDDNKNRTADGKLNLFSKKNLRYRFVKKPVWDSLGRIWCHRNRKTRYKDFIYMLRNPHSALLFLNSENVRLKKLAEAIVKGYRIIFPREVRYYGNINQIKSRH